MLVNYKRVERLYQDAQLQVRRRKRKKVPMGDYGPWWPTRCGPWTSSSTAQRRAV